MPAVVRRLLRVPSLSLVVVLACAAGIFVLGAATPTGFLPEEDQGAFFIAVQLPDGASVARTRAVVRAGREDLMRPMPQVEARALHRRLLAARWRQPAERGLPGGDAEAVRGPRRRPRIGRRR